MKRRDFLKMVGAITLIPNVLIAKKEDIRTGKTIDVAEELIGPILWWRCETNISFGKKDLEANQWSNIEKMICLAKRHGLVITRVISNELEDGPDFDGTIIHRTVLKGYIHKGEQGSLEWNLSDGSTRIISKEKCLRKIMEELRREDIRNYLRSRGL